jgi:hypothetical protein
VARGTKNCDFGLPHCWLTLPKLPEAKEPTMKTILLTAAAMGLSISAAAAECVGHNKVTASTDTVDTQTQVASIQKKLPPPATNAESTEVQTQTQEAPQAE